MVVLDSRGWCIVCIRAPETSLGRRRSQCSPAFGRPDYWAFPVFLFCRNYSPALPRIPRVSPETVILKEHEIEQVLFSPTLGKLAKAEWFRYPWKIYLRRPSDDVLGTDRRLQQLTWEHGANRIPWPHQQETAASFLLVVSPRMSLLPIATVSVSFEEYGHILLGFVQ